MLGEVDSSIFFAMFVKKRIKWVVYPLNELHIEVDLARKRIFALQFAPPAPARLSTIWTQPFSKNVGETSSFLFYGYVFPSFRLPPQGASVKFLVLIHAYYYGLYDRPQRNDVSPH